jgi:Predicted transcriptional regulators
MKDYRQLRKSKGLTLRQVQKLTGISNSYLSQLENGKIKKPSHYVIQKLDAAYSSESQADKSVVFSEQETKWLLFYGQPSRESDIRIDDENWQLDYAVMAMFDFLEKFTGYNRAGVEKTFWKRIRAMANFPLQPPDEMRSINNNPTGKPFCCHNECNKDAAWEIRFSSGLEDYIQCCDDHLIYMIGDNKEVQVTKIKY